ncbi:hypothetical protein [Streptomyces sp. NPDC016845]|uniref:hypothetical protein n=1 Tax=Streptomyces sp. NPDC016845 TaxID=3364972 RepID=UPI00379B36B9
MSDFGSQMWGMAKSYRFAVHSPEELWTMVEPADGSTATDLGALLTAAAKTIKEIGGDLKTHSTAVEWKGEGADAFHKWVDQAARATLSLGDYSESAGKWLGHAADTLHEVKPQLEALKNSSASARSVLDAHDAAAKDVGNHGGGPSTSSVKTAKTQYDNDRAEAALLMTKLAQSYSASTEQIDALQAPEFPALPKRFVPENRDDVTHRPGEVSGEPSNAGTAAAVSGAGVLAAGAAVLGEAAHGASLAGGGHQTAAAAGSYRALPDLASGGPATSLDRAATLPSATAPAMPSPASPPSASPGHLPGMPPGGPGAPPPVFGGAGRSAAAQPQGPARGRGPASPVLRGPLGLPEGTGAPGAPRGATTGREIPAVGRTGIPGVQGGTASQVRGPGDAGPARSSNAIAGGRPVPQQSGRGASAIPRGTVVGGSPAEQGSGGRGGASGGSARGGTAPGRALASDTERGTGGAGGRAPARSDGVTGGQPRQSPRGRSASSASTRATGVASGPTVNRRNAPGQRDGDEPARGSSSAARHDGARSAPARRLREEAPEREDTEAPGVGDPEVRRPERGAPELRLPDPPHTARRHNEG